jgi:hypothetical protein
MSVLRVAFNQGPVARSSSGRVTVRVRSMTDRHRFFHIWLVKSLMRRSNVEFNL